MPSLPQEEAASAQAVKRGPKVTIIEVPDEDDDTAFQIWLAKESAPTIVKAQTTTTTEPRAPPTVEDRWFKPFEVDWTLRAIREARNDNAACAALFVWTHKDRTPELTPDLLAALRLGGETAREQLYQLREPPLYIRRA